MFFFSLRTTMLYKDQITFTEDELANAQLLNTAIQTLDASGKPRTKENLREILMNISNTPELFRNKDINNWLDIMEGPLIYNNEMQSQASLALFSNVIPCLEIVEFCRCTSQVSQQYQAKLCMTKALGGYVFYIFIANIFRRIHSLIACNYVVLYAADSSPERLLIQYYRDEFGFMPPKNIKTIKAWYDSGCALLVLEMSRLFSDAEYYKTSEKYMQITEAISRYTAHSDKANLTNLL